VFGSSAPSVCSGLEEPTLSKLRRFGGVVEQIYVRKSDNEYVCEDRVINPATGETEFRQSRCTTIGGLSISSVFNSPELFKNMEGGTIHRREFDLYWDNERHSWRKIQTESARHFLCPVDESLLIFSDHPIVQAKADSINKNLAAISPNEKSGERAVRLKAELQNLLSTKGDWTIALRDETTRTDGKMRFTIDANGFIRSIEEWNGNVLVEATFNRVIKDLPFTPTEVDSSLFEASKHANVSEQGLIGVRLVSQDDKLVIAQIAPGSPAETAGMLPNEQILSVNGKPLRSPTIDEFYTLGRGSPSLTIETSTMGGEVKKYIVPKILKLHLPDSQ
jgi:hypothetical protein